VLEGWSREAAAEACAMDRQTLRDWVHRYNELGLEGPAQWKCRASWSALGSPAYRPYRRSCSAVRNETGTCSAAEQRAGARHHTRPRPATIAAPSAR
jgi:hypothetical protein